MVSDHRSELKRELTESLQELRLPTIRAEFEESARRQQSESLSYEQYLPGVDSPGARPASSEPDHASSAAIEDSAGEDLGRFYAKSTASEGESSDEDAAGRRFPRPR